MEDEKFRSLNKYYSRGTNGAVLMYDIKNSKTLDLIEYLQIIQNNVGDLPMLLVGNKIDLEKYREISEDSGILFAKKYNLSKIIEMFLKTGENIEKLFKMLTEVIINHYYLDV